jgi:predicted transcriptional regulator
MMEDTLKKILVELEMMRKLKMVELVERGYSQAKIGGVLGLSQATISRMMSSKKASSNRLGEKSNDEE